MRPSHLVVVVLGLGLAAASAASEPSQVLQDYGTLGSPARTPPVEAVREVAPSPGPGSEGAAAARAKGVTWILANQHPDGGWSSGSHGTDGSTAASDVATTAFSVLALLRDAGGSARHRAEITRGVGFVLGAVENAPSGPRLRTPEGTQIQYKLGQLVDTHLAALMLGEVAGRLDPETNARVDRALDVVVAKVQQAQRSDGSFDGDGWAPVLSTSIAAQSLGRAVELGKEVEEDVLARSDSYQAAIADTRSGGFDASAGAGVELYAVASALRSNSQTARRTGDAAPSAEQARAAEEVQAQATSRVAADSSGQLMAGFGSIGGEEVLSYMMISDALAEEGGAEWRAWEARVGAFLAQMQNADGSWVGHHCITSRAFTTAGAVLTLAAGDHAALERRRG